MAGHVQQTIRREVEVIPTPAEVAKCFVGLGSDEMALFFNRVAELVNFWGAPLAFQLQAVCDDEHLTAAGRGVMREIGEYSHNGHLMEDVERPVEGEGWAYLKPISTKVMGRPLGDGTYEAVDAPGPGPVTWEPITHDEELRFLATLLADPALVKIPSLLNLCCERAAKLRVARRATGLRIWVDEAEPREAAGLGVSPQQFQQEYQGSFLPKEIREACQAQAKAQEILASQCDLESLRSFPDGTRFVVIHADNGYLSRGSSRVPALEEERLAQRFGFTSPAKMIQALAPYSKPDPQEILKEATEEEKERQALRDLEEMDMPGGFP